jgi:hypothetical protein
MSPKGREEKEMEAASEISWVGLGAPRRKAWLGPDNDKRATAKLDVEH